MGIEVINLIEEIEAGDVVLFNFCVIYLNIARCADSYIRGERILAVFAAVFNCSCSRLFVNLCVVKSDGE